MAQVRETKTTTRKPTEGYNPANTETTNPTMTADQRRSMIQMAAYLRAEKRGFKGGDPVKDWVDAEREVDATLTAGTRPTRASTN